MPVAVHTVQGLSVEGQQLIHRLIIDILSLVGQGKVNLTAVGGRGRAGHQLPADQLVDAAGQGGSVDRREGGEVGHGADPEPAHRRDGPPLTKAQLKGGQGPFKRRVTASHRLKQQVEKVLRDIEAELRLGVYGSQPSLGFGHKTQVSPGPRKHSFVLSHKSHMQIVQTHTSVDRRISRF